MSPKKIKSKSEVNIFRILVSRFLPYWPLFAFLIVLGLLGGWLYLRFATRIYEATATLIIKDEKKGVDDSKLTESINPFTSKKIVENEIDVIQSRALMYDVVDSLNLYAPTYEENDFSTQPAYAISPIRIELKEPFKIKIDKKGEPSKYYFSYNPTKNEVEIGGGKYPINTWINNAEVGQIKFKLNPKYEGTPEGALYYELINPKMITYEMLENLEVSATNKLSSVVGLAYEDPVPQRAEDILNQLIYAYNKKAFTDRNKLAENTLEFIEKRIGVVEVELDTLERKIQEFRYTKGAVDLSEQGRLYLQNVEDYDRQIADINRQLAVLDGVKKYVISKNNQTGIVPSTTGVGDPVLAQLLDKLYNAEIHYEKLKKTTAENNPILVSLENEIKKIRPSILENIDSQKSNLMASLKNLNYNSNKSNSALKTIPENERTLLEISRQKTIKSNLFSFLQQKREEAALAYAPDIGDGKVVDMAESSLYPVSPKGLVVYLLALIFTCGIGMAYVLGKELLNKKVLFRSEIEENTDIPVVAELPFEKNKIKKSRAQGYEPLLLNHFRQLGVVIGLYNRNFNKQKILVTSSIAGEGKSFISSNLAYSLSLSGKEVVLMDLDFIRPNTSKLFGLSDKIGVLDFLDNKADAQEIIRPLVFK